MSLVKGCCEPDPVGLGGKYAFLNGSVYPSPEAPKCVGARARAHRPSGQAPTTCQCRTYGRLPARRWTVNMGIEEQFVEYPAGTVVHKKCESASAGACTLLIAAICAQRAAPHIHQRGQPRMRLVSRHRDVLLVSQGARCGTGSGDIGR